jgi:predicted dinucleotide-binding enzyme
LTVTGDDSAGETVLRLAPGARVVKAFNNLGPAALEEPLDPPWSVFVAGDDPDANDIVAGLCRDIGTLPVPAGPLTSARYLEAMVVAVIRMRVALQLPFTPHPGIGLVLRSTEPLATLR